MEMRTYGHLDGQNHPAVGSAARDMMDRPDEEAGSVLSTAKSYLAVYRDPVVARNVSKSEFRIRDLMHHEQPVSLYILTQPNDKTRLRPLVRVMVSMIVHLLADKLHFENGRPVAHYRHRLLMMLDEFPSLGNSKSCRSRWPSSPATGSSATWSARTSTSSRAAKPATATTKASPRTATCRTPTRRTGSRPPSTFPS
jgi:hypothetical protein